MPTIVFKKILYISLILIVLFPCIYSCAYVVRSLIFEFSDIQGTLIKRHILSNPTVMEIKEMFSPGGHGDQYVIYMEMNDGKQIKIYSVDYDFFTLKFSGIWRIGDYSIKQLYLYLQNNEIHYKLEQPYGDSFKEKYEKLNKLFTCKKVDFLLINYRDIVDEVNNLPLIEEEFLDWLKNQEDPMPEKYKNVIPNTIPPKSIPVRLPIDLCDF